MDDNNDNNKIAQPEEFTLRDDCVNGELLHRQINLFLSSQLNVATQALGWKPDCIRVELAKIVDNDVLWDNLTAMLDMIAQQYVPAMTRDIKIILDNKDKRNN